MFFIAWVALQAHMLYLLNEWVACAAHGLACMGVELCLFNCNVYGVVAVESIASDS